MNILSNINHPAAGKKRFLFLTIIAGIIILFPYLNFQPQLAQGDHGRDLYLFKKIFEGAVPYRDYATRNGPLMPYYYSQFYRLFGVSIQSVLLGFNGLILLTGVFLYLACARFCSPLFAFLCALWYWAFRTGEFFYTFNHIGAICLLVASLYCLFRYIKSLELKNIFFAALPLLGILLIRPNIGVATLTAFFASAFVTDLLLRRDSKTKNLPLYISLGGALLLTAFIVYWSLVHGLPKHVGSQELAYWSHSKLHLVPTALISLGQIFYSKITSSPTHFFTSLIFFAGAGGVIVALRKKSPLPGERGELLCAFIALGLYFACNICEFIVNATWFRYHWVLTIQTLIFFFVIDRGFRKVNPTLKQFLAFVLCVNIFVTLYKQNDFANANKIAANNLRISGTDIYLPYYQQQWIQTVTATSNFIVQHVPEGEKIAAIAYCPMYYFFTNRDSVTRDLKTPASGQRELDYIQELEAQHINYILLSNRAVRSLEWKNTIFGITYDLKLNQYIQDNFKVVAIFGPWQQPAGWLTSHAIMIFKRKGEG